MINKGDEWHNKAARGYVLVTEIAETKRGARVRFQYGQIRRDGKRDKWGQMSKSLSEFEATVRSLEKVKQ